MAPRADVYYGPAVIPFVLLLKVSSLCEKHFAGCCAHIRLADYVNVNLMQFSNLMLRYFKIHVALANQESDLWHLAIVLREMAATEDIAKIYGLLGMVSDTRKGWSVPPDYRLTVADVYRQVALNDIRSRRDLACLNFDLRKKKYPHLPSWVIDWSYTSYRQDTDHYSQIQVYNATLERSALVSEEGRSTIALESIFVDEILSVGSILAVWDSIRIKRS